MSRKAWTALLGACLIGWWIGLALTGDPLWALAPAFWLQDRIFDLL